MSATRAWWELERVDARARDEARRAEATVHPMRGVVGVHAIHVLDADPIDPFWRTQPPVAAPETPEPGRGLKPAATRPPRDPWAVLPESVRVLQDPDGFRRALVAERVWMGGVRFLPELFVQRLHATGRDAVGDFHADLRGCAEETRAWALEAAERVGLEPGIWRLTIEVVEAWTVDRAERERLPYAPSAKPDPDPVFQALAIAQERQVFMNRAEFLRVDAAVRAWRVALQDEGLPGAANTPYQAGFFRDLGLQLGVAEGTAKSMVHIADRLACRLPAVWSRFAAADVPWRAMQAAHAAIDGMTHDEVLATFDTEAAALMGGLPTVQLPDALRRLAERLQPTTLDDRFERAMARRFVRIEAAKDGMGWLTAFLPMVTLAAVDDQLTKAAIAERDRANGETGGITVLRADILCDGLVDALARDAEPAPTTAAGAPDAAAARTASGTADPAAASGEVSAQDDDTDPEQSGPRVPDRRGVQARVGILIPALTALGHAEAPATLEGYGPIGMKTALALAGEATSWIRVLTDQFTGAIIDVGREKYRPTADMRAMLRMIDGGGRGPGCTRPPSQTEVDHNESFWLRGERGDTAIRNLVLLSKRDHAGKTAGECEADLLKDRTLLWETRAGNRYVTRPHDPPVPTPVPIELIDPDDLDDPPF